ncbi:MAG TPA: LysE family transporter [Solimonas sp.]|nr:LysE family transporter [Solimonas sp.]
MSSSLALFTTVAVAHLLAVMSPGPDFAMVTRQTLAFGRAAGLWTAWGIATGIVFHVGYGLFGLGWLIQQVPALLEILRYAGAAFLLWMGWGALRAKPADLSAQREAAAAPAARQTFGVGVMTNLLNPKATLFFVALFSTVITAGTPVGLRVALGAWIILSTGAWFSVVAVTLGHARVRQGLRRYAHWIDRAMGVILVALALVMLLAKLR